MPSGITITSNGICQDLESWLEKLARKTKTGLIEASYVEESTKFNKSKPKQKVVEKKMPLKGTLKTKIFSKEEIKREEERMAKELRQNLMRHILANAGKWMRGSDYANLMPNFPKSSVTSVLSRFMSFFMEGHEEIVGIKLEPGQKGKLYKFKGIADNVDYEAGIWYDRYLNWERKTQKEARKLKKEKEQAEPDDKKKEGELPRKKELKVEVESKVTEFDALPPANDEVTKDKLSYSKLLDDVLAILKQDIHTLNVNVDININFGLTKAE
jgi:hypothetical protein